MRPLFLGAAFVALLVLPRLAEAQTAMERDYRRTDRPTRESRQRFAFEARFGSYAPDIDAQFPGKKPYETAFGGTRSFYFGAELDWQAIRIPYIGTLGPGAGWGYTRKSAKAKATKTKEESGESTYLTIMPMYLVAVLRVDVLAREVQIPIVPFLKAGLGFGLWSAANDDGVSVRDGVYGRGRSWGSHIAFGGMFLLDVFDRAAALGFDEEVGVNNSYVFFEWQMPKLDGQFVESRPQLHIGTSSWVLGLALEF